MSEVWAYRVKIETGSADEEGLLVFIGAKLAACLVRLDDEHQGELRGRWCIEAMFGSDDSALGGTDFADADQAVAAITTQFLGSAQPLSSIEDLPARPR